MLAQSIRSFFLPHMNLTPLFFFIKKLSNTHVYLRHTYLSLLIIYSYFCFLFLHLKVFIFHLFIGQWKMVEYKNYFLKFYQVIILFIVINLSTWGILLFKCLLNVINNEMLYRLSRMFIKGKITMWNNNRLFDTFKKKISFLHNNFCLFRWLYFFLFLFHFIYEFIFLLFFFHFIFNIRHDLQCQELLASYRRMFTSTILAFLCILYIDPFTAQLLTLFIIFFLYFRYFFIFLTLTKKLITPRYIFPYLYSQFKRLNWSNFF